jgi:fatty acid-binding protein DegV
VAYTYDREAADIFREEIQKEFPHNEIIVNPLSLSVSCHIGPGSLAITCSKKIEV